MAEIKEVGAEVDEILGRNTLPFGFDVSRGVVCYHLNFLEYTYTIDLNPLVAKL